MAGNREMGSLWSSGDSIEGDRALARPRSLRSDRVPARAQSLRSDRAKHVFGCCIATLFELLSDDSCFFRKAFRKEESISKKYLSKKVSTFSSSGILTLTSLQPFSTPTEIAGGDFDLLSGRAENNGREAVVDDARDRSVDPEFADVVWCRSIPFRLGSDGSIEQLLDLPQENFRLSVVSELDWGDVLLTQSSVGTVLLLLKGCKACGVTLIIPRAEQRPWSAPIGYHCVYESFF
ncbi:hypothetical protein F2Q69_00016007 [Brassica cretica]|uniref:Uncharacterized protein n=1 Tax=Brassica cretica TaxID=69181 RepID=A0A8S9QX59_BRACR|nr:hypothetical protein F2Q69_00016007 [Brassica cretica]